MHDSSLVSGKTVGGTLWLLTSLSKISPQPSPALENSSHWLRRWLRRSRVNARRDLEAELRHDGRFDVVDIVEANDPNEIERPSMIIRAIGRSRIETMLATEWKEFLDML